jgi:cytochrome b6-f complex iron-sulfur subunit
MNKEIEENTSPKNKDRRDFLNLLLKGGLLAWLISIVYPIYDYLEPPKAEEVKVTSVDIGKSNEMAKDSGKIIKFGSKPVIVIRLPNGEYRAFSANCTHLDCIVQYRKDLGQIYCACHNGRYDLNGKNVSGPPPAPLQKYNVSLKGDDVIIFKNES